MGAKGTRAFGLARGLKCLALSALMMLAMTTPALAASGDQAAAASGSFHGFIDLAPGKSLYVDWLKAQPGKETIILLNGLTYDTTTWQAFTNRLKTYGYGVFRYDPVGMGKTLQKKGSAKDVIPVEEEANDLDALTRVVGLTGPLNILGLSYGGGLAIAFAHDHADRIGRAILMAPYTQPLAGQDQWIRTQIATTRLMFPLNPATDDELYAYFLEQNIDYVYPMLEPSVNDFPLKPDGIFQLVQGIRKYDMKAAAQHFPQHTVHLVIAGQDQYIDRDVLESFWAQLPPEARASQIIINGSEHKIPEAAPDVAAKWVDMILTGQVDVGAFYTADAKTKSVQRNP